MSKKSLSKKFRLRKAHRSARAVPAFVRLKTKRKVMSTPSRRHWRSKKLRTSEKE